jgi:hypothetical protein
MWYALRDLTHIARVMACYGDIDLSLFPRIAMKFNLLLAQKNNDTWCWQTTCILDNWNNEDCWRNEASVAHMSIHTPQPAGSGARSLLRTAYPMLSPKQESEKWPAGGERPTGIHVHAWQYLAIRECKKSANRRLIVFEKIVPTTELIHLMQVVTSQQQRSAQTQSPTVANPRESSKLIWCDRGLLPSGWRTNKES